MRIFGSKKKKLTEGWGTLTSDVLHRFWPSQYIRMLNSRR